MIFVTSNISLRDDELLFTATRATGPGGQHVNTTSSAVHLKFDAAKSTAINPGVLARLRKNAGSRMNSAGILSLNASSHRSQHRNRADAQERLVALIQKSAMAPKYRRKTKPSKGSVERRLSSKSRAGTIKKTRGRVSRDD
ncbi:MAG: aminoacyl-tRNA hydrolase [Kordiimonadales bacterium]|nr:MAG: aminoacyl-tRNA hydrolase [Kordiimonadales bacterium]